MINEKNLKIAYNKLKRYAYHSNDYSLIIKIAEYDKNHDTNIKELKEILNQSIIQKTIDERLKKQIKNIFLPKSIQFENDDELAKNNFISNFTINDAPKVIKDINMIEQNVNLQITSILWILLSGYKLVANLENNYGNMLVSDSILFDNNNEIRNNDKLFKVYWSCYKEWRNNAIKEVTTLYDNNKSSVMLALDIKEFYGSVRINESELNEDTKLKSKDSIELALTNIIIDICKEYSKLINKEISNEQFLLPIGLIASPIVANWYLAKFDKNLIKDSNPSYYGRYVDDIICIFHFASLEGIKNTQDIIKNRLSNTIKNKRVYNDADSITNEFELLDRPELSIQSDKLHCIMIDKKYPIALFEKFKSQIDKQSSEFRFIPDIANFEHTFNTTSSRITYSDSINKLRSIKEFNNDKFGVSTFLSKAIFMKVKQGIHHKKVSADIIKFFSITKNILEYRDLWGKIFIYLVVTEERDNLEQIYDNIEQAISKLENKYSEHLRKYRDNALTYALSIVYDNNNWSKYNAI